VRRVLAQAGVPAAAPAVRATLVDPYRAFILQSLEKYPSLRASRLYTMVRERGYPGAPDHFRAIVARLPTRLSKPTVVSRALFSYWAPRWT